jgi:bifunctional UDP-N-acetylglucosamine pyrophosphorylase/glucosamine-1-phosphate N-acetyltransferase
MTIASVILAAGQGTRMRSRLPKVLHPILGQPMMFYSLAAAREATGSSPLVVVGHGQDAVRQAVGEGTRFVVQEEQLGTGHAVQQAAAALKGQADYVLITAADMPLLTADTLEGLVGEQRKHEGPISMLTLNSERPRGFGRVVRDEEGNVRAIVEEAQASPRQLEIRELNAGVYCFEALWLWENLPRIPLSPKGEYYLTDMVALAVEDGLSVRAIKTDDPGEVIGVNTRVHLAEAEAILRERINRQWMLSGVTLVDPGATYIEPSVTIGVDTTIWPNTYLQGTSVVGDNCTLGPNTLIRDTHMGDNCRVLASVLENARLEEDVDIGPFGHLRKGAHLAKGVHMGNFGEVKNSHLGPGTKMGHFSYLGDANIGPNVNIGAGTITCNYDGVEKHPTEIGADVFIGSDTMLVAPLKIGARARTGAGAVVTKDVPSDTLAVGVPARVIRKLKERDR